MTTTEGTTSYGYDANGQLTSVGLPGGRTISYQYDAAGNRIAVTDTGATTTYTTNNMTAAGETLVGTTVATTTTTSTIVFESELAAGGVSGSVGVSASQGVGASTTGGAVAGGSLVAPLLVVGSAAIGTALLAEAVGFNDAFVETFLEPDSFAHTDKVLSRAQAIGLSVEGYLQLVRDGVVQHVSPVDPNDISGPLGFGSQHFVTPDQTFPYIIHFENLPAATAPALVVAVTQQLDANLDWSTFELGDFGFGKYIISVPAGRRFYSTRVDASDTRGAFVDVVADFDPTTGQATWTFTSVDPATGALPEGVTDGFLPPEDGAGSGQGFVTYRVRSTAGGATGTTIPAQARVIFEAGLPDESFLDTPTFTNTFDAGGPTSSVTALPASSVAIFSVAWTGSDNTGGSGIATFDVFVSDDGGAFMAFQTGTAATSADFTGEVGHSYRFYSVATDNVGHVEQKSPTAEAETIVRAGARWQNATRTNDVDDDGFVSPVDVLQVINELNAPDISLAGGRLPDSGSHSPPPYLDVNGDGFVSPIDALVVINFLNNPLGPEGETRSSWFVIAAPTAWSLGRLSGDDLLCKKVTPKPIAWEG